MEEDLIGLLRSANSAHSAAEQRALTLSLAKFNALPGAASAYLSLFMDGSVEPATRGMAGLLLKNLMKRRPPDASFNAAAIERVMVVLQQAPNESGFVVGTAATILAVVVDNQRTRWPDVLAVLLKLVASARHAPTLSACLLCIERVLEEVASGLVADHLALSDMLLTVLGRGESSVRVLCVKSINHLLSIDPDSVDIDALLCGLSASAASEDSEERRQTCACLSMLWDVAGEERMAPSRPAIHSFMLRALNDHDEAVGLEACEYWLAAAERSAISDDHELLAKLLPALANRVIYSADDPEVSGADDDEPGPRVHKAVSKAAPSESDSSDTDEQQGFAEWTLRKCAASCIDQLSCGVEQDVFLQRLLPCCEALLASHQHLHTEAAILILGAIAHGCKDGLREHWASLAPFLISNLHHEQAIVRSIAAWTVGRYSAFVCQSDELLAQSIDGLLALLLDRSVKCRRAACSALMVLSESPRLEAHVPRVFGAVHKAVHLEDAKAALPNLFDLTTALLYSQHNVGTIDLHELIQYGAFLYLSHNTEQALLYPLLECLSAMAEVVGPQFAPFAESLYNHSIGLVGRVEEECERNDHDADVDTAASALDFVGSIVRGVRRADQRLVKIVLATAVDSMLLQAGFAVAGDLALFVPRLLVPSIGPMAQMLLQHFDPSETTGDVAGNAVWAWGQIVGAEELRAAIASDVPLAAAKELCRCLLLLNQSRSYYDNTVLALGKTLAFLAHSAHCPDLDVAAVLQRFSRLVTAAAFCKDEAQTVAAAGMLQFLHKHHGAAVDKHPAEVLRIAVCASSTCALARGVIAAIRERVAGASGWEEWRRANVPDISNEALSIY